MRRAIGRLLDGLSVAALVVLAVVVLAGGGEVPVAGMRVAFHDTRNPAIGLLALLGLRRLVAGAGSPAMRPLLAAAARLRDGLAARPALAFRLVVVVAALQGALMSVITVRRHEAFESHAFDLGIFDQVLWNAANGRGLESSILGRHFFGEHFSPALWAVAQPYRVAPDVRVLLVIQSLALASGAVAVGGIARRALGSAAAGPGFAIVYALYAPMRGANLYDFHPVALATPLLLFAIWAMEARRWTAFTALALAALSCQEELGLAVGALGLWAAFAHRRRALGGALAAIGAAWVVVATIRIIPAYRGADFAFAHRYAYLGDSIGEILRSLVTRPDLVARNLFDGSKGRYLLEVFGPLGLLSFASPAVLLAAPTFLQNVLSDYPAQWSIDFQYTAPLTPFVFHSAILGCRAIRERGRVAGAARGSRRPLAWVRSAQAPGLIVAGSLIFLGYSPAYHLRKYRPTPDDRRIAARLREIPPDASVSAQDPLVPHLSHRRDICRFPDGPDARFVALDLEKGADPLSRAEHRARVAALLAADGYRVAVDDPPLLVLERRERASERRPP
jgi:uncharacterized membrane protein